MSLFGVFIGFLLFVCVTFAVVFCEESMEHELRPPEEGVDRCVPMMSEQFEKHNGPVRFGQLCPVSNQFWYYNCCGEFGNICCLQLQPMSWLILGILVPVAIGLLALQLLCGLFTHLFNFCCCCTCCYRHKTEQ